MLATLPSELLCHIYSFLPHPSHINQVSLTCRSLYSSALPTLYSTVILSFRTHIRQLEKGLSHGGLLSTIVRHYTKTLVLTCKQSGHHRLIQDVRSLLHHVPGVQSLTLTDFSQLPIETIVHTLFHPLPQLSNVSLRYCNLVSASTTTTLKAVPFIHRLEVYWTDFPADAMATLLRALPSLTHIRLLANHNRHVMANTHTLAVLPTLCPAITDLDLGLQEIDEQTLVHCLQSYGAQLTHLALCSHHGEAALTAITQYCLGVRHLAMRGGLVAALGRLHPFCPRQSKPQAVVLDQDQLQQLRSL
ncbi:hypothetical protein [Absidia glauca]|uniref:F-box domain-containing protein n=1 Tax=Absidia glauca TaxID=4829 RepID=A0A168QRG0_ABSGL|nr:hypothetical protein [Absidia glauca]